LYCIKFHWWYIDGIDVSIDAELLLSFEFFNVKQGSFLEIFLHSITYRYQLSNEPGFDFVRHAHPKIQAMKKPVMQ
jgi:hypothetical protein